METVENTPRLTEAEKANAKAYASGEWGRLSYDALTGVEVWIKREGSKLHVREMQRVDDIIEHNNKARAEWSGWSNNKAGAVTASIPNVIWQKMIRACGYDGSDYDRKKYRKMLNDSDYSKFKIASGRI